MRETGAVHELVELITVRVEPGDLLGGVGALGENCELVLEARLVEGEVLLACDAREPLSKPRTLRIDDGWSTSADLRELGASAVPSRARIVSTASQAEAAADSNASRNATAESAGAEVKSPGTLASKESGTDSPGASSSRRRMSCSYAARATSTSRVGTGSRRPSTRTPIST